MKLILVIAIAVIALLLPHYLCAYEPSPSFIGYLRQVEGYRQYPYECAGGARSIGYGHNLDANPLHIDAWNGLNEQEATLVLIQDVRAAYAIVLHRYGQLDDRRMEILTEFTFNMGSLRKFPKFEAAVLANDIDAQRREYKRYTHGRELGRNRLFYSRYLK